MQPTVAMLGHDIDSELPFAGDVAVLKRGVL